MNLTRYAESSYLPPPSFTLFSLVPLSLLSHTPLSISRPVCVRVRVSAAYASGGGGGPVGETL